MEEDEILPYGGVVKAPKILSGIVESIAAAVYVDCGFDLKELWLVFRDLLEPIVTLETLQEFNRPVTELDELCLAQGKQLKIKQWKTGIKHFTSIYVGGELVASASSYAMEKSRVIAAWEALRTLAQANVSGGGKCGLTLEVDERKEVVAAKLKLSDICVKQKWPEPSYRVEKEEGQSDVKKYVCSVHVEVEGEVLVMRGFEQLTMEDAENSAASFMICSLLAQGHVQRTPWKRGKSSINSDGNDKGVGDEIKIRIPVSGDAGKETDIRRCQKRRPAP